MRFLAQLLGWPTPDAHGKMRKKARRYIPPEIGVEPFFQTLRERNARYALLRWFDGLPDVKPGSDIDILIHDKDIDLLSDLFVTQKRGIPCDLFSVSGRPGTAYRGYQGIAYLPPDKALELIDRAVWFKNLYRVPGPEDHFLSLAYHAVYQKGPKSGLPTTEISLRPVPAPRHDYATNLKQLADTVGIDAAITMEDIDEYLAGRGWRPPPSILAELAKKNPWIAARFNLSGG